jgi:hypothetical protein
MSQFLDSIHRLQRQFNKVIEILGDSLIDICPNEYSDESDCPKYLDCQRCWEEALMNIK